MDILHNKLLNDLFQYESTGTYNNQTYVHNAILKKSISPTLPKGTHSQLVLFVYGKETVAFYRTSFPNRSDTLRLHTIGIYDIPWSNIVLEQKATSKIIPYRPLNPNAPSFSF